MKANETPKQYISKSALVAELARQKAQWRICKSSEAKYRQEMLDDISSFINTLEVKEEDLNNEYVEEIYSHIDSIKDTADRMTSGNFMHNRASIKFSANTIAKVLDLIGLKSQEGD